MPCHARRSHPYRPVCVGNTENWCQPAHARLYCRSWPAAQHLQPSQIMSRHHISLLDATMDQCSDISLDLSPFCSIFDRGMTSRSPPGVPLFMKLSPPRARGSSSPSWPTFSTRHSLRASQFLETLVTISHSRKKVPPCSHLPTTTTSHFDMALTSRSLI